MQSRREKIRESTIEEIKQVAWVQMAEGGANGISLRGIAAQLGMAAPSLYNYYKNRDDLITALIVDAYTALGNATNAASESLPQVQYGNRFLAVSLAFRQWGVQHREQFILVYGTPIPGYHAPAEITTPSSARATYPFIAILEQAWRDGKLHIPAEYASLDTPIHQNLSQTFQKWDVTMPATMLQITMEGWSMIHGGVSLELYGHLDYLGVDLGEFYRAATVAYLRRIGIAPD